MKHTNSIGASASLSVLVILLLGGMAVSAQTVNEIATLYEYDNLSRIISIDGPRDDVNDITAYTYHTNQFSPNFGRVHTITNGLGHVSTINAYNASGDPVRLTDPNGVERLIEYNQDRMVKKITIQDPDRARRQDSITEYEYNSKKILTLVKLPNGTSLSYDYDGASRLVSVSNNLEEIIEFEYDEAGNQTAKKIKSSSGSVLNNTSFAFDELSRIKSIQKANGQEGRFSYDASNNNVESENALLNSTSKAFDPLKRLTSILDAENQETKFQYNDLDLLASVEDANGNITEYSYDDFGRLVLISSPDTGVLTYSYDAAGNRTRAQDSRGVVSEYTYDALNRLSEVRFPASHGENVQYLYDDVASGNFGIGRLTGIQYENNFIGYRYNHLGLLVEKSTTIEGVLSLVRYEYDAAGQLKSTAYPSGRIVRLERDELGRIQNIFTRKSTSSPEELILSGATYLPFGPVNHYIYGNGLSHNLEYDESYRLTRIHVDGFGSVIDRSYQYDVVDNVVGIDNSLDSQKSQSFDYDSVDRLIHAEGAYGEESYSYDPVGNRLTRVAEGQSGTIQHENYIYDSNNNQLRYVDTYTDGIPSQSREFAYDAAGNRIEGTDEDNRELLYEYNNANRLWRVSHNGQTIVEYGYNPLGQRVKKSLANGLVEHYHYNEAGQLIAVMNDEGISIREYIYRDSEQIAVITRPDNNQSSGQSGSSSSSQSQQSSSPILLEANSAVFSGNHVIATDHQNYTGDGFIDFIGEGFASWEVDVPAAGDYLVDVRYAVSGGNRPLDLVVDGSILHSFSFPSTGSFNAWESVIAKVSLSAGLQTLSLVTTGASGPNVDRLELRPAQLGTAIKVDESGASFVGAHLIASNFAGYDGVGFIDVAGEGEVHWSVAIPREGSYLARIRYALGAGLRPMQLSIGGQLLSRLNFAPTGTFENWNELLVVVSLPAGSAQLQLSTLGASGPNIDFIELIELNGGEGVPEPPDPVSTELQMYFIHNDHLGTPQVVTNINQQVAWMADYLPFGKMVSNPANEMELYSRFPGQYVDEETGHYYNYFRDYDPSIGRYIQSDPIGIGGGLNTYLYAKASPFTSFDFWGLCPCDLPLSKDFLMDYMSYDHFTGEQVWKELGGSLGYDGLNNPRGIVNSCATRVSHALNAAGHLIPAGPHANRNIGGIEDWRYILSAEHLIGYLTSRYGPHVETSTGRHDIYDLQERLLDGQAAIVGRFSYGSGHVGVVTRDYVDHYTGVGFVWILPVVPCVCE